MSNQLKIYRNQLRELGDCPNILYDNRLGDLIFKIALEEISQCNVTKDDLDLGLIDKVGLATYVSSSLWISLKSNLDHQERSKECEKEKLKINTASIPIRVKNLIQKWKEFGFRSSPVIEISDPIDLESFFERYYVREFYSHKRSMAIKAFKNIKTTIENLFDKYTCHQKGTVEYNDTLLSVFWSLVSQEVVVIGQTNRFQVGYLTRSVNIELKNYVRDIVYPESQLEYPVEFLIGGDFCEEEWER